MCGGRQYTLIFMNEGQKTLIRCNGPVSSLISLFRGTAPILRTTVPCRLQRPVCSATSHCPACYEGDNENQLLDQRCRHNIKIICNLSSRDPAAQTQTTVHTALGAVFLGSQRYNTKHLHQPCHHLYFHWRLFG